MMQSFSIRRCRRSRSLGISRSLRRVHYKTDSLQASDRPCRPPLPGARSWRMLASLPQLQTTANSIRNSHAPSHPRRIPHPSRRPRKDRELPDRHREGGPGGGGGERHRRGGHAAESASEEGEEGARRRRDRVQVSRVRQLSRRVAPAPHAQDVDRVADVSDGVREGRARRRRGRSRAVDRERKAGRKAVGCGKSGSFASPGMTRLRVLLDTNVWLDWLVFDDPSIAPIKAAVAAERAEVFIDAACEAELERALGYDLGKRAVDAAACIAECRRAARRIESPVPEAERAKLPACCDPDDQKFLEAALAARAGFLITKDRALLELAARVAAFRILTPEGFAGALFAVGELRRDDELARAADSHAVQALFPAGHDLALAEGEFEGVPLFLAGIELRSVGEPAGVVHGDVAARRGGGALADDGILDGQAACGGDGGH